MQELSISFEVFFVLYTLFYIKSTPKLNCRQSNETNVMHLQVSSYKKRKRTEKHAYEKWKSSVIESNDKNKAKGFESISFSVFTLTHCTSCSPRTPT